MSGEDDMPGSAAANQHKTEPMPPTEGHGDPEAAPAPTTVERPDVDNMKVASADPQAPSHPAAGAQSMPGPSDVPSEQNPLLSDPDPAVQIETDVERSAQNADVEGTPGTPSGPGDARGVPVVSETASPGTSESSAVAQGTRTPL